MLLSMDIFSIVFISFVASLLLLSLLSLIIIIFIFIGSPGPDPHSGTPGRSEKPQVPCASYDLVFVIIFIVFF